MSQTKEIEGSSIDSYRAFPLSRPALSQLLNVSVERGNDQDSARKNLTFESIREATTLGKNFVQGMRVYARHTNLLNVLDHPTPFGRAVNLHDSGMSQAMTQWVMHYYLTSHHRGSPVFWRDTFHAIMLTDQSFTSSDIAELIMQSELKHNRKYADRTLRNAASSFVGTYFRDDALNMLGLLSKQGERYVVNEPEPPDVKTFAYVLADYWDGVWAGRTDVLLREVTEKGGPASLLMLGSGDANQRLMEMQEQGLVEVRRRVPPYLVVRLWKDSASLLERLYA